MRPKRSLFVEWHYTTVSSYSHSAVHSFGRTSTSRSTWRCVGGSLTMSATMAQSRCPTEPPIVSSCSSRTLARPTADCTGRRWQDHLDAHPARRRTPPLRRHGARAVPIRRLAIYSTPMSRTFPDATGTIEPYPKAKSPAGQEETRNTQLDRVRPIGNPWISASSR